MTLKKLEYLENGRITTNSGHKAFDHSADYIGVGSIMSNVQRSSFIYAFNETERYPGGTAINPGEMRSDHLKPFIKTLPPAFLKEVENQTTFNNAILYEFSTPSKTQKRVIHGYALTRPGTNALLALSITPNRKSIMVMEWCLPFITPHKTPIQQPNRCLQTI